MTRRSLPRALALIAVWIAPGAVCLVATAVVYLAFRIPPPDRLAADDRARVMASLRAALDERSEATGGGDPAGSAGGAGGKAPRGIDEAEAEAATTFCRPARPTRQLSLF